MAKKFKMDDDPFEGVLPHLKSTRKKKEDDVSESENTNTSKIDDKVASTSTSKNENTSNGENVSSVTSVIESKSASTSKGKITSESASEITGDVKSTNNDNVADVSVNTSNIESEDTSNVASISASTITIARKSKGSTLLKMTHYFRPDQLKAIDELHEKSGRDKSELVRMAVDILIERARVE